MFQSSWRGTHRGAYGGTGRVSVSVTSPQELVVAAFMAALALYASLANFVCDLLCAMAGSMLKLIAGQGHRLSIQMSILVYQSIFLANLRPACQGAQLENVDPTVSVYRVAQDGWSLANIILGDLI